jgi:hypothetical protein
MLVLHLPHMYNIMPIWLNWQSLLVKINKSNFYVIQNEHNQSFCISNINFITSLIVVLLM